MKTFTYTIKDKIGIHARPAGLLAKKAKEFKSDILIKKGETTVNATKLLMLMGLAIKSGETITISVIGEDEEIAAAELEAFFKENL